MAVPEQSNSGLDEPGGRQVRELLAIYSARPGQGVRGRAWIRLALAAGTSHTRMFPVQPKGAASGLGHS